MTEPTNPEPSAAVPAGPADGAGGDLLGSLLGGTDGGLDLGSLLGAAQQMQAQLADAQADIAETVVAGVAGGGVVTIEMTGGLQFRSVKIDPSAVDPSDVGMLEDLVLAALHDATARAGELQSQAFGGLGMGAAGGGLSGLLGG